MPIIKSAQKKLRQDKKRTVFNKLVREKAKDAVKAASKQPNKKTVNRAYSLLDQAVKKRIIHKNKAARIKSRVARIHAKG